MRAQAWLYGLPRPLKFPVLPWNLSVKFNDATITVRIWMKGIYDIRYFYTLQHIFSSVVYHKEKKKRASLHLHLHLHLYLYPYPYPYPQPQPQPQPQPIHDKKRRTETFINFDSDQLQHKVELFKTLSQCPKKRQVRHELRKFGVYPNRF